MVVDLLKNISKCSFCGFCEISCPTRFLAKRNYTPRGRINSIIVFVDLEAKGESLKSEEMLKGIFTCLGCGACKIHCPAGVDIPEAVRSFKAKLNKNSRKVIE
ncbi:MAG: (Fe-S)-binding protein [Archaeoglobales archaeon]|nr:(Fe-S)-binding protein [Archaeoglobales archaeon]